MNKNCPTCHEPFSCNLESDEHPCWCKYYPNVIPVDASKDCLCPGCLSKVITEQVNQSINDLAAKK